MTRLAQGTPSSAVRSAMRAAASSKSAVSLVARGHTLVLVIGATKGTKTITAHTIERTVSSAGFARAVLARYQRTLDTFPHLGLVGALDAAIQYQEAGQRFHNRPRARLSSGIRRST